MANQVSFSSFFISLKQGRSFQEKVFQVSRKGWSCTRYKDLLGLSKYISFETPKAGYYIFPKLLYTDEDATETLNILKQAKVSVVPGSAFWPFWKGHFRICFGRKYDDLAEAVERLKKYFELK